MTQRGRCRRDGVEDGGGDGGTELAAATVELPASPAPLVDRLKVFVDEGVGGAVNLVLSAPAPHPYLLGAVHRGPTNH